MNHDMFKIKLVKLLERPPHFDHFRTGSNYRHDFQLLTPDWEKLKCQ